MNAKRIAELRALYDDVMNRDDSYLVGVALPEALDAVEALQKKGEQLCHDYGKSLIEIHDLKAEVTRLREALKEVVIARTIKAIRVMARKALTYTSTTISVDKEESEKAATKILTDALNGGEDD